MGFEWLDTIGDNQVKQIAKAIQDKTAIALTDGSYKVNGTAGFSIGSSFLNMWQGACQVPGHITSQGAYRSEIAGIYATLQLCKKICEQFNVTTGALTLACNNIAAGKSALLHDTYPDTNGDSLISYKLFIG